MAKEFIPQIVTANDLLEGDVIYLTKDHNWSREHSDALVAKTHEEAVELLALGAKQADIIVGAYLANIKFDEDGKPAPIHFREAFRTRGPSNYFHGKQAQEAN